MWNCELKTFEGWLVTNYLSQQKQLTNIARIAKAAAHMGPGRLIINAAPRA